MAAKISVLVDLNVILDVMQQRRPFYEDAARVLDAAARGEVAGWIAAHSVTTLFYIVARTRGRATAVQALSTLLDSFTVAGVDDAVVRGALSLGWSDFEDAVQMAAAGAAGLDYLITRDSKGFAGGAVPVVRPAAFLALLG